MTPFQLLDSWRGVLEASQEGSELGWDEFNHDRQAQNFIQLLLDDEDLQRAPQFELWAHQVAEVDHAYREMLVPLPGVRPGVAWWLAGVPSAAGKELAHDLSEMFGLQVKLSS